MCAPVADDLRKRAETEPLLQVMEGDVCDYDSLVQAMRGCRASISSPNLQRSTQLIDVFYKIWDPDLEFLGAWG